MADKKEFYCLRCQHRFMMDHDPKQVVERSCPKCGSNSVRLAPKGGDKEKQSAPSGG